MNRLIFTLFVFAASLMLAPPMANAQLFRRGCSTGHCFTPVVHHAAPVIEKRDILQNFFIGLSPGYEAPRGTTAYARDLASEVQLASDLDYINLSKQFLSSATDVAATARSIRPGLEEIAKKNADANLKLATGEAAATVIRSLEGGGSQARTVVMTLRNGKLEQFQELTATPAEVPVDPAPVPRSQPKTEEWLQGAEPAPLTWKEIISSKCASCHSAAGKAKNAAYKDLRELDGEIDEDALKAALARINSKDKKLRMPKGGPALTAEEKEPLYQELMERMK